MSDSDPDYIPTPSQLPDQDDSDFDLDIDELCRGADRRLSSPVNFDAGIMEYQTCEPLCAHISQSTSRSTRGQGKHVDLSGSAHDLLSAL